MLTFNLNKFALQQLRNVCVKARAGAGSAGRAGSRVQGEQAGQGGSESSWPIVELPA